MLIIAVALAALAGMVVAAGSLAFSEIRDWLDRNRIQRSTGEVLRKKMNSGQYTVVAGIFSESGTRIAQRKWTACSLDPELDKKFDRGKGRIVVKY